MLAIQKQPKYLSKVMVMPNGVEALVVFELIERNGHIIAKAIYAEAIPASSIPDQEVIMLEGLKSPIQFVPVRSTFSKTVSSFIKDFSFVISQPTRAPSNI